jgi:hypothetical protein
MGKDLFLTGHQYKNYSETINQKPDKENVQTKLTWEYTDSSSFREFLSFTLYLKFPLEKMRSARV